MELQEIRLQNLRRLVAIRFNGVVAQFARAIGKDRNQARFILHPEKPGGRWLGEKQAREIEATLGLPRLSLDFLDGDLSSPSLPDSSDNDAKELSAEDATLLDDVKRELAEREIPDHIRAAIRSLLSSTPKKTSDK